MAARYSISAFSRLPVLGLWFLSSWLLALGSWIGLAHADQQSANYRLEAEIVTGGGNGLVTSTNYKVEENTIDWFTKSTLSSASYSLESLAGIQDVANIPVISSVEPGNYARFFTDESASFTVNAATPDGDPLTYEAKQDGTTKVGPQTSNVLSWTLGDPDKGRHALDLSVIEQHGTVTKPQAAYVFRRPVK